MLKSTRRYPMRMHTEMATCIHRYMTVLEEKACSLRIYLFTPNKVPMSMSTSMPMLCARCVSTPLHVHAHITHPVMRPVVMLGRGETVLHPDDRSPSRARVCASCA